MTPPQALTVKTNLGLVGYGFRRVELLAAVDLHGGDAGRAVAATGVNGGGHAAFDLRFVRTACACLEFAGSLFHGQGAGGGSAEESDKRGDETHFDSAN